MSIQLRIMQSKEFLKSIQKMNNQAFPLLSHFIKVALFGIVIEKKIHAAHARVREFDGIERLFWLPKRKVWPPFYMVQSIFYFIYFAISPAPCCVYFLKNGQMQHFSCRTFTAEWCLRKPINAPPMSITPFRIFVTDCAAKQK